MDILFLVLLAVASYIYLYKVQKSLSKTNFTNLVYLYFYHLLFGLYYYFFVFGDSIGFWNQSSILSFETFLYCLTEQKGTLFIYALNYIPANVLGLSYFTGTMIYTFIGFLGVSYFYRLSILLIPENPKINTFSLFPFLFFLPNLHFWSCAVGKDTLLFFAIGIASLALTDLKKKWIFFLFALFLSYLVRPHITLFILVALAMSILFGQSTALYKKVFLSGIMVGLLLYILPNVMEFARLEEATLDSFNSFAETKASKLGSVNNSTAIDISSYPFVFKVFTFLFRPLPFDINSIPTFLAALENLLLVFLFVIGFKFAYFKSIKSAPFVIRFMVYFLIIGTVAFSQTLGNLGIMLRMRNMFLPAILFIFYWHFYFSTIPHGSLNKDSHKNI